MRSRRVLRILLTVVVVGLFTGYFAFSTFFFQPLEGDYEPDLATLIDRDVDFYLSKARLSEDFAPLPRPVFADAFEASKGGQALQALDSYQELMEGLRIQAITQAIEVELAKLPVEIEPLDVVGGEDVAVAGKFKGPDLAEADWTIYARVNWMGKLGVEVLKYPALFDPAQAGLSVTELEGDVLQLQTGSFPRPLFVTRHSDVVVAGTVEADVRRALELAGKAGQDTLFMSAEYGDHIHSVARDGDELEIFVDYRALADSQGWPGSWPDVNSDEFVPGLLGRMFQVGSVRELAGALSFGGGTTLRLHGRLSSEAMSPFQKRLYRARGFDTARVEELATFVPPDVGVLGFMHVSLGDLLRQAMATAEDALVSNLEDLAREVWAYPDLHPLIDDIDAAFKSRVAFFVRANDYPKKEDDPPSNDAEVMAWALVLWVDDRAKVDELKEKVVNNQNSFGIRGRNPGDRGVWSNVVSGNTVIEFWSELVDGTGHIATLSIEDLFVIGNHYALMNSIIMAKYREPPSLADDSWFASQLSSGLPNANAMLWLNPRAIGPAYRKVLAAEAAYDLQIDWSIERPRLERKVLKDRFPTERLGQMSTEVEEAFQAAVDAEAAAFEQEFRAQHLGGLVSERGKSQDAVEILRGGLFQLAIDPKEFDFFARLIVPLD